MPIQPKQVWHFSYRDAIKCMQQQKSEKVRLDVMGANIIFTIELMAVHCLWRKLLDKRRNRNEAEKCGWKKPGNLFLKTRQSDERI